MVGNTSASGSATPTAVARPTANQWRGIRCGTSAPAPR
jgi:hypothetical protein